MSEPEIIEATGAPAVNPWLPTEAELAAAERALWVSIFTDGATPEPPPSSLTLANLHCDMARRL